MKKDENAFIKVLIILVIASLALLAIVYLMVENSSKNIDAPTTINTPDITDNNNDDVIIDETETETENNAETDSFDNMGRLVVHQDISVSDDHFFALCDDSDWQIGDEKEIWYKNDVYNYQIKIPYTEFYNDDLIVFPYLLAENNQRLIYDPTVTREIAEDYNYTCGPHGPIMGITLTVEDPLSAVELKDETKPKFEEITIGDWYAVSYVTGGYAQLVHIVLLGDVHNYHFTIESENNKTELINVIENNFELLP